jgi:hypothetical protein
MSNVERFSIEGDSVNLLLNKFQRHRGDTLNSRMFNVLETEQPVHQKLSKIHSNRFGTNYLSAGRNHWCEARALVSKPR